MIMEQLPSEIISHIFDYVDAPDVERASEVCRSFFIASLHPRLVNKLFIGRKTRCNSAIVSQSTFTPENATLALTLQGREEGDDLSWNNANANYPPGTEVKSLVITTEKYISPYLYVVILNDILKQFPSIEDLELKRIDMHVGFLVDAVLSNHLQNLVMLKLTFIEHLPNFSSGPTISCLPEIKSLTLETEVSFISPVEKRKCTARQNSVLNIQEFRRICEEYHEILDEIDVMFSILNEENMRELCSWLHPNIQTIKLSRCAYIDDNAVNILSHTVRPRVLEIDSFLSNSETKVSGNGVAAIAIKMKSVEYLSFYINDNIRLNDDLFESGFLGLRSLSMTSYGERSSHCLVKLSKRKLCVENLCKIDGTDLLVSLAKGSPGLRELSLELICEISDRDVIIVAEKFPNIRLLKLNSCCELTDKCLTGIDVERDFSEEMTHGIDYGSHICNNTQALLGTYRTSGRNDSANGGDRRDVSDCANPVEAQSSDVNDSGSSGPSLVPSSHIDPESSNSVSPGSDVRGLGTGGVSSSLDFASSGDVVNHSERSLGDQNSHSLASADVHHDRSFNQGSHGVEVVQDIWRQNTRTDGTGAKFAGQGLSNELVSQWLKSKIKDRRPKSSRRSKLACTFNVSGGATEEADSDSDCQRLASWNGKEGHDSVDIDDGDRSNSAPMCNGSVGYSCASLDGPPMNGSCNKLDETTSERHSERQHSADDFDQGSRNGSLSSETRTEENIATNKRVCSAEAEAVRLNFLGMDTGSEEPLSRNVQRPPSRGPEDRLEPCDAVAVSTCPNTRQTVVPRKCMRDLKQLESLCLVGCCELSDRALSESIAFPLLTYLKLTHCDNLSDRGVEAITSNNPSLNTFILEFCRGISDESVKSAVKNIGGLERTKFENCRRLTGAGLKHVSSLRSDSLKEVYISGCPISRVEIEEFKETCPGVKFGDFDW